jgi:hypothetical protein
VTRERSDRDLAALLDGWMNEVAPTSIPVPVLEEAFARTTSSRQLRVYPWERLVGRGRRSRSRTAFALVATAAVLMTVLILGSLGGGSGVAPAPSQTPSATTAPPAATTKPSAAALYRCERRLLAWDGSSAIDLTGTWAADDDGVYYVRQLGDEVWWLGMSGLGRPLVDRGTEWTNVYRGTLKGDTVTGAYADVPGGAIQDNGPVVMKLTKTSDGGITLVNANPILVTGFGGSTFTPCELG